MAFVIVRRGADTTTFERQTRLRAIERLNLTLLIGAKHAGMLRWIDVESDDVLKLLREQGIVADLECLHQMWLEPV